MDKLLGWQGGSVQLTITDRNGRDITGDRLIDPRAGQVTSTMATYGRGQTRHLTELSYRQRLYDDRLEVQLGRFGTQAFGAFPCDFQNLMFCGNTAGAWTGDIFYNYPIAQWAAQFKVRASDELALQFGVFEHNPTLLERDEGFKLSTSGSDGVVLPVEMIWTPTKGLFGLPGEYRLGAFYSSADASDVYTGADGQPQPLTADGRFKEHAGAHGYWMVARQQVGQFDSNPERPIEVFSIGQLNDERSSYLRSSLNLGVVLTGPFTARPRDALGFAIGRVEVNQRYVERVDLINQLNGMSDYRSPDFLPLQDTEYSAELYYGVHLTNWLTVRPNLQFLRHPGGVEEVDDAVVAGMKVVASF
ncbi:Porin B precursor [compost metagenome]